MYVLLTSFEKSFNNKYYAGVGGGNQCPPPNRKTGKTRTTPLLSKTPSHTPAGKHPVEGARASFGTSFWLGSGHLGDN